MTQKTATQRLPAASDLKRKSLSSSFGSTFNLQPSALACSVAAEQDRQHLCHDAGFPLQIQKGLRVASRDCVQNRARREGT